MSFGGWLESMMSGSPYLNNENTMTRIADLNDEHRKKIPRENFAITGGVQRLGPAEVEEILEKVRRFDDFNEDNDPHREHDF